jgi:hypothetical protein
MSMRVHLRGLVVALILAVASAGLVAQPAQAEAPPPRSVVTVGTVTPSQALVTMARDRSKPTPPGIGLVSIDAEWTGWDIRFNRAETGAIAAGLATCGAVVGKLPGPIKAVISVSCSVLGIWAAYAAARNYCLGIWMPYSLYGWHITINRC